MLRATKSTGKETFELTSLSGLYCSYILTMPFRHLSAHFQSFCSILISGLLAASLVCCKPARVSAPTEPPAVQLPSAVRVLSPQAAAEMLKADASWVILDARHWDEMRDAPYLSGAQPCPFLQGNDAVLQALDREGKYFVYCPLGERAARTAARMHELGFTTVATLAGGLYAWQKAGLSLQLR
jgi:rhodanese-related sulfurtransferase